MPAFGASAKMQPPSAQSQAFDATFSREGWYQPSSQAKWELIGSSLTSCFSCSSSTADPSTAQSLQRLKLIHHSRNKLRHCGMNVHRPLKDAERLIAAWNERQVKRMPMLFSQNAGMLPCQTTQRRVRCWIATLTNINPEAAVMVMMVMMVVVTIRACAPRRQQSIDSVPPRYPCRAIQWSPVFALAARVLRSATPPPCHR